MTVSEHGLCRLSYGRLWHNFSGLQILSKNDYVSRILMLSVSTVGSVWHPSPVLLPGKSHGQRSLVGYSPWGLKESDMTERLHYHFSLSRIGEGNGNPLQCSCLENPRDGGAWWAAIYGVAQSRTRLKRLSSSTRGPAKWDTASPPPGIWCWKYSHCIKSEME